MLLYVVRGIASFVGSYYLSVVSNRVVHDLRTAVFNHIMYLPTRFYDDNNSGHIISRVIFNTGQVTHAATDALKTIVREGFTVIGLLGYVFYLNWKMSLVFIAVAPIIGLLVDACRQQAAQAEHKTAGFGRRFDAGLQRGHCRPSRRAQFQRRALRDANALPPPATTICAAR